MPIELEPDSLQRRADAQTRARVAQRLPGVEYGIATFDVQELQELVKANDALDI